MTQKDGFRSDDVSAMARSDSRSSVKVCDCVDFYYRQCFDNPARPLALSSSCHSFRREEALLRLSLITN